MLRSEGAVKHNDTRGRRGRVGVGRGERCGKGWEGEGGGEKEDGGHKE